MLKSSIIEEKVPVLFLYLCCLKSCSDGKEAKDSGSTTEELELELETLDIADDPIELEGPDEAENEELAKKLLDEQGKSPRTTHYFVHMQLKCNTQNTAYVIHNV